MELSQELTRLLQQQRANGAELEAALAALEQSDLLQQNEHLREQNAALHQTAALQGEAARQLAEENSQLRERLMEQLYSQRSSLLQNAQKQAELLIGREQETAENRLAAWNIERHRRMAELRAQLAGQEDEAADLLAALQELDEQCRAHMRRASGAIHTGFAEERRQAQQALDAMQNAPISPAQTEEKLRQNSIELKIGSKITVIVGVFFMLLAVIFGLRYTFLYLLHSNLLKGLLAYLLGGLFLAGGEWMHRKYGGAFATGLCAGGVAILFASTAVSYFNLAILSIPLAVGICVVVTALALVQALRYNAQVVAVFALLGGYLPMTALDNSTVMVLSAMGYFLLLNLFVLLVAVNRRWQPLKFFSLFLGMLGVGYLLYLQSAPGMASGIVYVLANVLLYMAIILVFPILRRTRLYKSDTVLLAINTVFGCGYVFLLLDYYGYQRLNGAVALAVCLLYFVFGRWLRAVLEQDSGASGLFFTTSLAFWVLAVPLQFEPALVSLGWLCEGVALYVFGTLSGRKWYRRAGGGIALLCFASFLPYHLLVDFPADGGYGDLFLWKYIAITLGALVMVGVALYKFPEQSPFWQTGEGTATRVFRVIALGNLWLCGLYTVQSWLFSIHIGWDIFWKGTLYTVLTLGLAAVYRAVPALQSRAVGVLSRMLYVIGFLQLARHLSHAVPHTSTLWWVFGLLVLVALCGGAVLALYDFLRGFQHPERAPGQQGISMEWVGLGTGLYALVLVLQLLMVQGDFGLCSMAVSFLLIAWAFGLIIFGFVRRYAYMRRFGLGLSLLAISKLFLLDLYFLQSGQRILSYFVFGVVFIAISYVYQLFSRRLFPAVAVQPTSGSQLDSPADPGDTNTP